MLYFLVHFSIWAAGCRGILPRYPGESRPGFGRGSLFLVLFLQRAQKYLLVWRSELKQVFRGTMRNHRTCSENHKSHDDSSFKSLQIALNSRDGTYRLVREHFYQRKPVYATEQKGHCVIYLTTLTSSLRIASSKVQFWGEKSLFLFVFNNFSQLCVTKSALPDMNSQFWENKVRIVWKLPVISLSGGIRLALLRVTRVWCAGHHKPLYSDFRKMGFNRILRLQN